MATPSPIPILYVSPTAGRDTAVGSATQPLKTLHYALTQATPGTRIQLLPGLYNAASGELFPIVIPAGISVVGQISQIDHSSAIENADTPIRLEGGGLYTSETIGQLNVTLCLQEGAELQGVTIVNPEVNGTGIWLNDVTATLAYCIVQDCGREGILLTGQANGLMLKNRFLRNRTSGLTLMHTSKGEIRENSFEGMPLAMAVIGQSAPLIVANVITDNRSGIAIAAQARPVLRSNRIESNQMIGLTVGGEAQPDLGHPQDPGNNILRHNGTYDLRNTRNAPVISASNLLNPVRVDGPITFAKSQLPSLFGVYADRPGEVTSTPSPSPVVPTPTPTPSVSPPFPDVVNHWAVEFIAALSDRRLISGFPDGSFKPDNLLTRAEYAALLANTFDLPQLRAAPNYQDVAQTFWAFVAIQETSRMGFLAGFPDQSFRPQQFLTRIQTIVSLVSGLGLTGDNPGVLSIYRDRAEIPSYATTAVATATQNRLIVNYPNLAFINPQQAATRSETMVMLYQALVTLNQAAPIDSPYIVDRPHVTIPQTTLADGTSSSVEPSPNAEDTKTTINLAIHLDSVEKDDLEKDDLEKDDLEKDDLENVELLTPLTDLEAHWAATFIRNLAAQNLIQGFPDGTFQPDKIVTRAEYASLIATIFNPQPLKPLPTFKDVPDDFWARDAIVTAIQGGFLAGTSDMTFQPNEAVLRFQVLLSLASGLRLSGGNHDQLRRLTDYTALPGYAYSAVAAALEKRLVVNYPDRDRLRPKDRATRAEVAAMIYQTLVYQGKLPVLASIYIF